MKYQKALGDPATKSGVLKVARTIADINENEFITKSDLLKSLNFRKR